MPDNQWTDFIVPASGYAFDAKHWNSLAAPNRNLDYLYESQYTTDAHLQLTYTGLIATGAVATIIPWTSAVSQNYPSMWDSGNPTYIFFNTGGDGNNDLQGLWGINLTYSYSASTTFTEKRCNFLFNAGSAVPFTISDVNENTGTNAAQQTFFAPWLAGFYLPSPEDYLQVSVRHASAAALTITANLFVTKIPSPVNNFINNIV